MGGNGALRFVCRRCARLSGLCDDAFGGTDREGDSGQRRIADASRGERSTASEVEILDIVRFAERVDYGVVLLKFPCGGSTCSDRRLKEAKFREFLLRRILSGCS